MTEAQPAAKAGRGRYVAAGIAAVLLIAITIGLYYGTAPGGVLNTFNKIGHKEPLPNDISGIRVPAGHFYSNQFSIPESAVNIKVSGKFVANGGSDNDIIALIMSDVDYLNWQNGHSNSNYYDSGRVTAGNIDMTLPAGQSYYLVFDNTFSAVSDKTVDSDLELTYYY